MLTKRDRDMMLESDDKYNHEANNGQSNGTMLRYGRV